MIVRRDEPMSARRFPIVVCRDSAFVPGPTNFLVGEGDFFPLGHLRGELRAGIGHAEINRTDIGVRQTHREMLFFNADLVGREKLELEGRDIFVGSENAVEEGRGAIEEFGNNERLVSSFARGSTACWVARTDDFVHDRDDTNGSFASLLGH